MPATIMREHSIYYFVSNKAAILYEEDEVVAAHEVNNLVQGLKLAHRPSLTQRTVGQAIDAHNQAPLETLDFEVVVVDQGKDFRDK